MKRCSFCEWIPILPMPVWPLAGQCALGQNVVVGSMALLLAVRGNIATRSMSGPPCALQLHRTTVWCGATGIVHTPTNLHLSCDYPMVQLLLAVTTTAVAGMTGMPYGISTS